MNDEHLHGMDYTPPKTHPDDRDDRIADLERQLADARKDADALRAELATAKADTQRLDWLDVQMEDVEKNGMLICQAWGVYGTTDDIRQAIDTAMKEGE
jgi:hypothetical protein